ncbi:MAG: hypothetical protein AB1916_06750 [Thermodesulfobacteriota bacterium]
MEGGTYLAGGYGLRCALEARKSGWDRLKNFARVWQPSRLKGILVDPEYGTPFLAATQVFDARPIPRKWLAAEKVKNASELYVTSGMILVTRSGNVGRATLTHAPHENTIISDDLLRVEPHKPELWGWLYAYLRSPQARAMMRAAHYGHVIKHLETSHLDALPMPILRDDLLADFNERVTAILSLRNRAHELSLAAEERFKTAFGHLPKPDYGENGFTVRASSAFFGGRRRFDALPHNPEAKAIREHLAQDGKDFTRLVDDDYQIWLPTRFKRILAEEGLPLLDSSQLFEISPDAEKRIADGKFGDAYNGRVESGWLLLSRSGQIYGLNGTLTLATKSFEDKIVSDHVIRIAPGRHSTMRPGYVYIALSHPDFGRPIMKSLPYGSSVPEIDVADVKQIGVVRLATGEEGAIADMAEEASALRADADIQETALAMRAGEIIDCFIAGSTHEVSLSPTASRMR